MNPEFSQRPFAVGSLMGVRSFRLTSEGVLTGVVHQEPWAPGVNEAICRSPMKSLASMRLMVSQAGVSTAELAWTMHEMSCRLSGKVNLRKRPAKPARKPLTLDPAPHEAGTLGCTCGFYAYFDEGHNPHHYPSSVLGIIEGYGVCTTGTRGFRSSKARLRALIFDDMFRYAYPKDVGRGLAKKIQSRYPDVPIFWTLEAALAEFPLTPVEGAEKPAPAVTARQWGKTFTMTMQVDAREMQRAIDSLIRAYGLPKPAPADESPRDRALRLRRERNTGPDQKRGLDGRFRR